MKTAKISRIESQTYTGNVYNLELQSNDPKHDDLFWVCNGIVVHNCFPKDLNALISISKEIGVDPKVMQAAWNKNLELRPQEDRDWEHMQGRAVSKKQEK
jgi:hypothetical protein